MAYGKPLPGFDPQQLTNAYLASGNAPTQQMIQGGYASPPPKFDPYADPGYAAEASALQTQQQHAQAERDYQYGVGQQTYGYDASGNLVTSGANLNPYSEAALLKRNYDNSVRGTDTSYAAQGQLYAGSRLNAQMANDYGYAVSSDQLKRAAQAFYHGQDTTLQGVQDQGLMQLAAQLGPAFQAFLASQKGS